MPLLVQIFFISIFDKEQRPVAILQQNDMDFKFEVVSGHIEFMVTHQNVQLSKGIYSINISVGKGENKEPILRINGILLLQILDKEETWPPFLLKSSYQTVS